MGWATLWPTFLQTHLVTLFSAIYFLPLRIAQRRSTMRKNASTHFAKRAFVDWALCNGKALF
jgi:ABC-type phosphate/phosphonate transport system permease subunit